MRKCRFCGTTVEANLVDNKRGSGFECYDIVPCVDRIKASIKIEEGSEEEQLVKEDLMTRREHIRDVFWEQWWDAAMEGNDVEAAMRMLLLGNPEKWE